MPEQKRPINKGKTAAAVTAAAMLFAAPFEGRKFTPYYDPPGILTVCDGHTGKDVIKGKRYTVAECDAFFTADMRKAVDAVDACVPGAPDSVRLAFADAAYNLGPKIACDQRNSTAARMLYAQNWAGACNQLPRWDKATVMGVFTSLPGLTRRRLAERDVCLAGLGG